MSIKNGRMPVIAMTAAVICLLTGCGSGGDTVQSGITVNEDLTVRGVINEEFDESQYSVEDLSSFIAQEMNSYNSEHGAGHVTALEPEISDGYINVTMDYMSADDYAEFNSRRFVIENLSDALAQNMLGVGFTDVKSGQPVDLSAVDKPEEYTVVITDEVGTLTCPGKIAYISDGVIADGKKQVQVSEDMDGLAYIVYSSK